MVPKADKPIRFGILGAANIAPLALILPAKSHPEVVILAVAARDKAKAEKFAKKHGIHKVYSGKEGYAGQSYNPMLITIPSRTQLSWTTPRSTRCTTRFRTGSIMNGL